MTTSHNRQKWPYSGLYKRSSGFGPLMVVLYLFGFCGCAATPEKPKQPKITVDNFHEYVRDAEAFTLEYFPYNPKILNKNYKLILPTEDELAYLLKEYRRILTEFGLTENGAGALLKVGVDFNVEYYSWAGIDLRSRMALVSASKKKKLVIGIRNSFGSEYVVTYRNSFQRKVEVMHEWRRKNLFNDLPNHFCAFLTKIFPDRPNSCESPKTNASSSVRWKYPESK